MEFIRTPGKGPVSTCAVDYSKLDVNSGSLIESSISGLWVETVMVDPTWNFKKYSVKTGNFDENIKGWLENSKKIRVVNLKYIGVIQALVNVVTRKFS